VLAPPVRARLAELTVRYGLDDAAPDRLARLLELLANEPVAVTSVRDPAVGVDVHIADALVALELEGVRAAGRIADLGSGGGIPGLVLAISRPLAHVALVESAGRKTAFLRGAVAALGLSNVEVVHARAEAWPDGAGRNDLVTARALAPLPVLLEYAAPLLRIGGSLVAWKGHRDRAEEADAAAAAAALGLETPACRRVRPYAAAEQRHLYLSTKVAATPPGYPRRPGMARKRPIRASS
jgi:16S rRNA (guanine527-N7)-methyltransferase